MWINARKISFCQPEAMHFYLYHDFRRELERTQVHCFIFFSTLHIYSSTCKHRDSIYNLVIVCLLTCYHKNSIKSVKFKAHFCLEKMFIKDLWVALFSFFSTQAEHLVYTQLRHLPSGQAKLVIFLFMWVSNREEENIKNRKMWF